MRAAILLLLLVAVPACWGGMRSDGDLETLRLPMSTDGPRSLDPVRGSTVYEARVCDMVYECLLQYEYLVRPPTLKPLLLAEMPAVSKDGRTYRFRLKKGVRFRSDPCFPNGKGREIVARDVFYSWTRMADNANDPKAWWLFAGKIVGFDAFRREQNDAETFDYDAPVEGLRILSEREFEVELTEPAPTFLYILAMFQTSVVAREAVEAYGTRFSRHPVGSGPFLLREEDDWVTGKGMVLYRNPEYRDARYPSKGEASDREAGLLEAAGKRIPFADRVIFTFFVEAQPMWLEFRAGHLDYTTVPAENFTEAFIKRSRKLRSAWRRQGVVAHRVPLLDFIFRGFNMDDELVGGYSEKKKSLRRAIHLAIDQEEFNDIFYNGTNIVYDGPIPPGLDGHPENHVLPHGNQGPDLERAREELAKAGYPGGEGLPKIDFWVSQGANSKEQTELLQRQLGRINVELNVRLVDFSQLIEAVHNKRAQAFSFAWSSDYPDAENNLALFYGPNESPGANSFNYKNPEYDRLYEEIRTMPPSPERTAICIRMRDMVIEDVPYIGSMARERSYLVRSWLRNCKPTETFLNWIKYLDVDRSER